MNGDYFHQELLALLKNAHDDIEHTKQRQWRDFYYVFFAIGAVTGLYRAVVDSLEVQWIHYLFFFLPIILGCVGIALVWASQRTLEQKRELIDAYHKKLDEKIQEILDGPAGKSVCLKWYPWLFSGGIGAFAIISGIIMGGLMCSNLHLVPSWCQW